MTNSILERAKFDAHDMTLFCQHRDAMEKLLGDLAVGVNCALSLYEGINLENARLMPLIQKLCAALDVQAEALKKYESGDHQVGSRDVEIRQCSYSGTDDPIVGKIARKALAKAKQILEGE